MFAAFSSFLPRRLVAAAAVLLVPALCAAAAPKVYVGNFADNTVSVIDSAGGAVVATIPVAAGPHGMAMSADGRALYVTGDGSSALDVIDTASDRVVSTIEVGRTPNGVALTPDGRSLLVAVYGEDRIAFVDTATRAITASVSVPKPHTIAIHPDGALAIVTSQEPGRFALVVLDLARPAVVRSLPLEKTPRDGEFSADGRTFYFTQAGVSAVQVLDTASNTVVGRIPTGVSPHFVKQFKGAAEGLAVVQGPGELLTFDPATGAPQRHIAVGRQPHWLDLSSDGRTAYVTDEGSDDVRLIDIASGKMIAVAVGKSPRKVVVQPVALQEPAAGATVSIAGFAFGPQATTVHAGESVTWSNDDGSPHTVTFKDGSPGSKGISPGQAFTRVFDRAGSYEYFCSYHPYMTGRVTVIAKAQ